MPSLITHIFIPLVILLIFSEKLGISKKLIITLSFFAIFPDMDIFTFHRATFHNIFTPLILAIFFYILFYNKKISMIVAYYAFSHTLLDTFNGGTYILYPIYDKVLSIIIGFSYKTSLVFIHQIEILNDLSNKGMSMAMISSTDMATLILISIIIVALIIKNKHKPLNT